MALLSAIILNSCISNRYHVYQNVPNREMCAYVLDTIYMVNPIIIEFNNLRYIVDSPIDSIPEKDIGQYLDSVQNFILGDNIFYDFPPSLYEKIQNYPDDGNCKYIFSIEKKHYNIMLFKEPPKYFILAALNIAYYNKKYSSIDASRFIKSYSPKNTYILLAYPLCNM